MPDKLTAGENLWLSQPASRWLEALPLGNGQIGAMVFGNPETERYALNHESLWRGVTRTRTTDPCHDHLPLIRETFFKGHHVEGAELAKRHLGGQENRVQAYQPVGDLFLFSPGHNSVFDYQRRLDLATGLCTVTYRVGDVVYQRESFISAQHGVLVVRIATETPAAISTAVHLTRVTDPDCSVSPWVKDYRLGFTGAFREGVNFAVEARVLARGGNLLERNGATLIVKGADELLVVLAIAVDYEYPEPADHCVYHLDDVPLDYEVLKVAHIAEHRALFDRVSLEIGHDIDAEALPLDQRLAKLQTGGDDPGLLALYFQYGRYLLMSSSRRCAHPANLQGIWNEEVAPPWECDFHHDINLEMNYWPAEVCNLAECADPLLAYLVRQRPKAAKAARDLYNCGGMLFALTGDIWTSCTPEAPGWDVWTGAAAWLAEHFWWRYRYSGDLTFLRAYAYPFLKEVAAFYEDYLLRGPGGLLLPVPSQSPENQFMGGSWPVSLCIGATMDFLLMREVFTRCLVASHLLEIDEELRVIWQGILRDLPPYHIGRHGQLQEWLEDYDEAEPDHRHVSHLLGVFPGEEMRPDQLPEFFQAARVSLERRLAAGGAHTGWSRAWTACLWARFGDGAQAYTHLKHLLTDFSTSSLLDLHPPEIFQIDGNLGGTTAVAEMLLQSHGGALRVLPALPPQWPTGNVRGLRAQGGFIIDIAWKDGTLLAVTIRSVAGEPCRLVWTTRSFALTRNGAPVAVRHDGAHLTFSTTAGATYVLSLPAPGPHAVTA